MRSLEYICIILLALTSCREAYLPEIRESDNKVMIVEGYIQANGEETRIRLTRSRPVASSDPFQIIPNASVVVESNAQESYPLSTWGDGTYSGNFILDASKQYRLKIVTDGKEYASSFEKVLVTPAIDSLTWAEEEQGIELSVNTHSTDPELQYFLWDYTETWEFHSKHESFYKYDPDLGEVNPRPEEERRNMYICYKHQLSSSLLLGTSSNLEDNIIYHSPLLKIPRHDQRLSVKYSLLVHQLALTRPAYDFYRAMKTNTETTGSIFGPQPTEISGNIKCISDPSELVIGYVSVTSPAQQRIFIHNNDITNWNYQVPCEEVYVVNNPDTFRLYYPAYTPYQMKGFNEGFYSADRKCIDCTLSGTNIRPAFW